MNRLKDMLSLRREADLASSHMPALVAYAEKIANVILSGEHSLRRAGMGEKFWQFREYQIGDRPQDIDWRRSARTEQIYIRQKEKQSSQKVFLWCASGEGMRYASAKRYMSKEDHARIILLASAILLSHSGEQIGLLGHPGTGRSELKIQQICEALLEQDRYSSSLPSLDAFSPPQNSYVIMASDFLQPLQEIEEIFFSLSSAHIKAIVIHVLDPAEIDLTFSGRVTFFSSDGHMRETINNVGSIRDAYKERIQDHIKGLYTLCDNNNWSYVFHRTDSDPGKCIETITEIMCLNDSRNVSR